MAHANKETLKSGNVLVELMKRFKNNPTKESLFSVLDCLSDSDLLVPVNANITDSMVEILKNSKVNDVITLNEDLKMKPDILQSGDEFYFPVFSQKEQIDKEYEKHFSWINLDIQDCINLMKANKKTDKMILDAFSFKIELDENLISIIETLIKNKSEK